jgi:hypothetical protein
MHQKEITIINLYAPNVNAPNFILDPSYSEGSKNIYKFQQSGNGRLQYPPITNT